MGRKTADFWDSVAVTLYVQLLALWLGLVAVWFAKAWVVPLFRG